MAIQIAAHLLLDLAHDIRLVESHGKIRLTVGQIIGNLRVQDRVFVADVDHKPRHLQFRHGFLSFVISCVHDLFTVRAKLGHISMLH